MGLLWAYDVGQWQKADMNVSRYIDEMTLRMEERTRVLRMDWAPLPHDKWGNTHARRNAYKCKLDKLT